MAGKLDLAIEQGATFLFPFTYENADGTPVDMTGWDARAEIRLHVEDADPLIMLTLGDGITIDLPSGTVTLIIDADATAAMDFGGQAAAWDMQLTTADSTIERLLEGAVTLDLAVTR